MSVGEGDNLFHDRVRQRLEIWIEAITLRVRFAIAKVLTEAGIEPKIARRRSQGAIIEIQGALILVRILQQPEIFIDTLNNLPEKLM